MSNVPFAAETANAPWNQPDAGPLPRCAYCGSEAEREYPDQSDADIALPYGDAERHDFCSRNCAMEYCLTVRTRRDAAGDSPGTAELRRDLTEMYRAASLLAGLDDEVLRLVEISDDGLGMLEIPAERDDRGFAERGRFVDLTSLRGVAHELCKLMAGEDRDPDWLCGDREWRRAEDWLEGLVVFRARHYGNEAWPRAMDLTREQIAALYEFYAAQCTHEAKATEQLCSAGEGWAGKNAHRC